MRREYILLLLILGFTTLAFGGKIYGSITEGGKPVGPGVKVEVACGAKNNAARHTNERIYTELMSSREQAESGLRKDMFLSIIQTFFRPESAGLEAKMLNLEMLAYNFHESLNLKPLVGHMDRQITASTDPEKTGYVNRLNQVAREISTRQLVLLEQVGKKFGRTVDFDKFRASRGGL